MTQRQRTFGYGVILAAIFAMVVSTGSTLQARQDPGPAQLLSPDQLDNLVAPIALYPDPLISQILVATTYPLEVVEASQWLQRNPNLRDEALTEAAQAQDWDPSIQALVVFPGVLKYLTEDVAWTTDLGNAFLAQEGDVMDAIQRMRDRAARSGKLATTAEQQVIRVEYSGQPVYEILPTNPTVVYVPVYDPYWIWGAPVYYPYARWYYPPHAPYLYFGSAVYIDAYFGTRWYGSPWNGPGYQAWNNWGWRPAWNSHNVVVNNVFINNHHFNSNRSYSSGTIAWSHEVEHRRGVVYPTTASFDRYRSDPRDVARPQQTYAQGRSVPTQVASRSAGTLNAPRQVERSSGRTDVRQDARVNTQQGSRPAARPDTRQDTRVVGRDSTPTSPNPRGSSDVRNDRGSSYQGSNRVSSGPAPLTPSRSNQLALSRPSTPAPGVSSSQTASSWSGTRNPGAPREYQQGRSVGGGASAARPEPQASYRGTASDRERQNYPAVRQANPVASPAQPSYQASLPRQSAPMRQSAPETRYVPAQRAVTSPAPSNVQTSPRQSAPPSGSASAVRSGPAQHQETASSNSQGGGRNSSGGSNGGGNSRGRR
jgi:Protein of unknown function (DUF3300)